MGIFEKFSARDRRSEHGVAIESVLRNLEHVLNSKRGWGSFLPDYGVSALTEHASRTIIAESVMAELRECITKYEPRLRFDSIELDDREANNPFWISFTLRCSLVTATQTVKVSINTVFGGVQIEPR
jgi:type VI secretion system lysozyme-like protein